MFRSFLKFWREEKIIIGIAILVFLVSAGYAFYFRIVPAVDARAYDQIARNLLVGQGFRLDPNLPLLEDEVITYQGPLFQFFLAGVYGLFGYHYEAVWLVHAFLRLLSVLLIFGICRRLFPETGRPAGWIAAGLFGFYPDLIEMSAMLMTETLFIFLTILTLYAFVRLAERITWQRILFLGLSFGGAILTRSSVGIFGLVFVYFLIKRRTYSHLVWFLVVAGLVMIPWTVRNYLVYGEFLPTMANFGYNFWVGNRLGADGEGGNPPELFAAQKQYGMIGANYYAMDQFKQFVSDHPFLYIKLTASRLMKYFSFIRPMGFWFYQTGWSQLLFVVKSALYSVVLFTLGWAGIIAVWRKSDRFLVKLIIWLILLTFASVVPILVETRYRLPIYPLLAIFAGYFAVRWWQDKKSYGRFLISSFLVLSSLSILDGFLEFSKIAEKLQQMF